MGFTEGKWYTDKIRYPFAVVQLPTRPPVLQGIRPLVEVHEIVQRQRLEPVFLHKRPNHLLQKAAGTLTVLLDAEIIPIGQIQLNIDRAGGAGDHLAVRGIQHF